MRNGAYTLAGIAAVLGLALLMSAGPGDGLLTSLGTLLLVVSIGLVALGKGVDLIGHVADGAADPDDRDSAWPSSGTG